MPQPVEVTVRTQLAKIIKDLDGIQKSFAGAETGMKKTAEGVDDGVTTTLRNTQSKIEQAGSLMKRVFMGLKDDVKALTSVGALAGGLKLSSTMKGTITDTIELSDTVRKLSSVFKIATKDQSAFVGDLTRGLGAIGLGSDAAARALEGLSETQVRGQENLEAYAKTAGMLAGASNQRGQEAGIAGGLAGVVQAQGKDVNDPRAMAAVAEQVNRTRDATGMGAQEILGSMKDLLTSMNSDFRKGMTPGAMGSLLAAEKAGGPGTTAFLKDFLTTNRIGRMKPDILGAGVNLLDQTTGVNRKALSALMSNAKGLGMGNVEAGLENGFGMSADQARGLKLLSDNMDQVERAAREASTSTKTLGQSFDETKTLGEAFKGNFDRVKSILAKPISGITGGLTDAFRSTQKSTAGSALVVAGSALAAAGLTKIGLGGVGAALGVRNAQERVLEGQGEKIQKVHVTNFNEMKAAGVGSTLASAAGSVGLGTAGLLAGGAALSAVAVLGAVEVADYGRKKITGNDDGDINTALLEAFKRIIGGATIRDKPVKVEVQHKVPEFRRSPPASTGANNSGVK